ncbi:MAG TPA: hypothetical protein VHD87_15705, partial [Acidimicrobiales bacterium]|nr:hypothetical protein [Acidimicrobiales bacterium]
MARTMGYVVFDPTATAAFGAACAVGGAAVHAVVTHLRARSAASASTRPDPGLDPMVAADI